jgi:hypothetical protein
MDSACHYDRESERFTGCDGHHRCQCAPLDERSPMVERCERELGDGAPARVALRDQQMARALRIIASRRRRRLVGTVAQIALFAAAAWVVVYGLCCGMAWVVERVGQGVVP